MVLCTICKRNQVQLEKIKGVPLCSEVCGDVWNLKNNYHVQRMLDKYQSPTVDECMDVLRRLWADQQEKRQWQQT